MTNYEWIMLLILLGNLIMTYLALQKTERNNKDIEGLRKKLDLEREKESFNYKKQYEFAEELMKWLDEGLKIIIRLIVHRKGIGGRKKVIEEVRGRLEKIDGLEEEELAKSIIEKAEREIKEAMEEKIPKSRMKYEDWASEQIYYLSKVLMVKGIDDGDIKNDMLSYLKLLDNTLLPKEEVVDEDGLLKDVRELGRLYFRINAGITGKIGE